MEPGLTYSKAFAALQKLVQQIENEDIQLDTLAEKVQEANKLIIFCETRLRVIENDVSNEQKQ